MEPARRRRGLDSRSKCKTKKLHPNHCKKPKQCIYQKTVSVARKGPPGKRGCKKNSVLIKPKKVHPGKNSLKCSNSGKIFSQSLYFKLRQNSHTEEKPYECSNYRKAFRQVAALILHHRIHSGVEGKAMNVVSVGKASFKRMTLNLHEKMNDGKKNLWLWGGLESVPIPQSTSEKPPCGEHPLVQKVWESLHSKVILFTS